MAEEMTETQKEIRTPQIKASVELWAAFDKWMALHGCQGLPEGLRAAMRQVTNFNNQCQEKSPQLNNI